MLPLTMDFGILNALILPLPGMGVVVGETGDAFLDVATLQWLEFRADMVEETSQLCLRLALEEGQRSKAYGHFLNWKTSRCGRNFSGIIDQETFFLTLKVYGFPTNY